MPRISPRARNILIILFFLIGVASGMLWWTFRVRILIVTENRSGISFDRWNFSGLNFMYDQTTPRPNSLPTPFSSSKFDDMLDAIANDPRVLARLAQVANEFPEWRAVLDPQVVDLKNVNGDPDNWYFRGYGTDWSVHIITASEPRLADGTPAHPADDPNQPGYVPGTYWLVPAGPTYVAIQRTVDFSSFPPTIDDQEAPSPALEQAMLSNFRIFERLQREFVLILATNEPWIDEVMPEHWYTDG